MALNVVGEALEKAKAAVEQARKEREAAQARDQATAQAKAQNDQRAAAAKWKEVEATIEDALEHAGISGVDVQIDEQGHARLVGSVGSDQERDTAVAMAQQFQISNIDDQLQIVAPAPSEGGNPLDGATGPVQYTVKAGESWWGIANRVYGSGGLWKKLKAANKNPKMIHPGTVITLPLKNQLG